MIEYRQWGEGADGRPFGLWTLNDGVHMARFVEQGARWIGWKAAGRKLLMGPMTPQALAADTSFVGATVGRYANRLSRGSFEVHGEQFQVPPNEGRNALHGGAEGLWAQTWAATAGEIGGRPTLRFAYTSEAGAMGFPGVLKVEVTYALDDGAVKIGYRAVSDAATVLNLTNHAYFNLGRAADVRNHEIQVFAEHVVGVDDESLPTGQFWSVKGSDFDLRTPRKIGEVCDSADVRISDLKGLDHCYALSGGPVAARLMADGLSVEVSTDQPGLQVYCGQWLEGPWRPFQGMCLETQHYPDSPNRPEFPSTLIEPGVEWRSNTSYRLV